MRRLLPVFDASYRTRPDVLVDMKEVGRVIALLGRNQAVVAVAVRRLDAVNPPSIMKFTYAPPSEYGWSASQ
jgi:hypothetical protein